MRWYYVFVQHFNPNTHLIRRWRKQTNNNEMRSLNDRQFYNILILGKNRKNAFVHSQWRVCVNILEKQFNITYKRIRRRLLNLFLYLDINENTLEMFIICSRQTHVSLKWCSFKKHTYVICNIMKILWYWWTWENDWKLVN